MNSGIWKEHPGETDKGVIGGGFVFKPVFFVGYAFFSNRPDVPASKKISPGQLELDFDAVRRQKRDAEIRSRLIETPTECFIAKPYSGYGNGIDSCPVWYKGIYYNSVTEARWACLFDLLGIRFEFESHKIQTEDRRMKPDFFLPDLKILVEVGPAMHDVFERKINKGQDLSDATGLPVLVTFGFPEYRTGYKDPITYGSRIRIPSPLAWSQRTIQMHFPGLIEFFKYNGPTVEDALGLARSYNFEAAAVHWRGRCSPPSSN